MKRSFLLIGILCLLVPFAFWGCSGDDGATGATGATGPPGPPGEDLTAAPQPESCAVCHGVGKIRDVTSVHAITGVASLVVVGTPTVDSGGNLVVTLDVTMDGSPSTLFTLRRAYVNYDNAALTPPAQYAGLPVLSRFQRRTITDNVTFAPTATVGRYTATVAAAFVLDNATYLFQLQDPAPTETTERPVAVYTKGTRHLRDLVTNTGCANCHGPYPAWSQNFQHYATGGSDCQICHTQLSTDLRTMEARTLNASGTLDNVTTAVGTNFPEYIHGIHNSHNMPGGIYYRSNPPTGETPEDLNTEERYSVGYPSDMRHCNVCHETEAQRQAIAAAPVTYFLCMSCHQNWDGFTHVHDAADNTYNAGDPIFAADDLHRGFDQTMNCAQTGCHGGTTEAVALRNEASDFHNDFQGTDPHYDSFYRGEDISFNPLAVDNVLFAITGIQKSGDNVSFTWTATRNGVAVNPCNDNISSGPTFQSLGAYLAYAKGDDWVNDNVSAAQSPGQPLGAKNLFGASSSGLSTTCASNVATTRGLVVAEGPKAYAQKALLAIGGKPLVRGTFIIGSTPTAKDYFVRVPSPTRAFSMADGSAVAARRPAVDSAKCNKCHQGTMYQHGGDRVDNEQMCVICHNPSSSEKNVRAKRGSGSSGGYAILNPDNTVNTSKTYDGKVAETYDMRYLLHAVHGAEKREKPIIIYRTRGIYAFAPPVYEFRTTSSGGTERISIEHPRPTGWPAVEGEGTLQPVYGSLENDTQDHYWTTIHYPKPLKDCLACHTSSAYIDPADQTAAVALTVDPGTSYSSQTDDIVIGPSAAACTGCHESTGSEGIPVQRHVTYDFGYKANVAKEVMLEKAATVSLSPALPEAVAGP